VSAAATRDDLAAVVKALTDSAAEQRRWQAEYEAKARFSRDLADASDNDLVRRVALAEQYMNDRHAALARGTATGYEVSADMISKYVSVPDA
jgi:hypothetical protein